MYTTYEENPLVQLSNYFGPAGVISFDEKYKTAVLHIQTDEGEFNTSGRMAILHSPVLLQGDTVLAAGNDLDTLFIIGILNSSINKSDAPDKIDTNNGAFARLNKNDNDEKIEVYNKKNELIFEYNPSTGNSRVNVESGDLEFISRKGDITFISEGSINFKSKNSVIIESLTSIQASVKNTINKAVSSLFFDQRKIKMTGSELNITTQRTDLKTGDMKYLGDRFSATLKYSKIIAGKLETMSNDIICKARNIYNTTDELFQLKARRLRTLIKNSLHVKAKNSYLKSEEDFKINGEKIHLG